MKFVNFLLSRQTNLNLSNSFILKTSPMISEYNFIGFEKKGSGEKKLAAFSTVLKKNLPGKFSVATEKEVEEAVAKAATAFEVYQRTSFAERAEFLDTIADEIIQLGDELIERA